MRLWKLVGISGLAALATAACNTGTSEKLFPATPGAGGSAAGTGGSNSDGFAGAEAAGAAGAGIQIGGGNSSGGATGSSTNCPNLPADVDSDEDGFTPDDGDANDCDGNVNPSALDVINYKKDDEGNPTDEPLPDEEQIDEDGDGVAALPSDPVVTCDSGLGPKVGDPFDAARALGLCNVGVEENPADPRDRKWGVIDAKFSDIAGAFLKSPPVAGANTTLQMGILPDLGPATLPYEGENMFALSSGIARAPGQEGFDKNKLCSGHGSFSTKASAYPPGFPKNGDCGTSGTPNDGMALDLRIRVPSNAKSFKFNFRFFTCEFPTFVCGSYNDVFAVLMAPSPLEAGDPMADKTNTSANIAFEASASGKKNVIGVNNQSFLTACKQGEKGSKTASYTNCGGDEDLVGSGFDGHGGSAWLESQVPIPEFPKGADRIISLRFAIWDSSDKIYDSSVVVDNFRWSAEEGTSVGTIIVPPPKLGSEERHMRIRNLMAVTGSVALLVAACSANNPNNIFDPPNNAKGGDSGAGNNTAGGSSDGVGGDTGSGNNGGNGTGGSFVIGNGGSSSEFCAPGEDADGDGWTKEQGDCNDCDKLVNPGALDVVNYELDEDGKPTATLKPTQVDEDCDGAPTDPEAPPVVCDEGLPIKITDPLDAARAIGLCNVGVAENPEDPKDRKWGVIAASFSDINGAFLTTKPKSGADPSLQMGILPNFGSATQPQEGSSLFALSSGVARAAGQEGAVATCSGPKTFASNNKYPPGFPKKGDCGTTGTPNDGIALDMKLRVPTNANSFKIRFKFLTCEFPMFVCQQYNDVFAVLMAPSPLDAGDPMADANNASANIAFESAANDKKNVIGVNNTSFLTACKPGTSKYNKCEGEAGLKGSGFEGHAASAWLETQVPIPKFPEGADRVISLRFAIWDSADQALDSSAVVDGFEWSAEPGTGVGTVIVPIPK